MHFRMLHERLVAHLRGKVSSGELTERRLARLSGVSQPHLHNVLKGVRYLSADRADQVLRHLNLTIFDLLQEYRPPRPGYLEIPILEGRLGPGQPFPDFKRARGDFSFPRADVGNIEKAVAVRLAEDADVPFPFRGGDMVLLAPVAQPCPAPSSAGFYAIDAGGSSFIRRFEESVEDDCTSSGNGNILEVVRARVIWFGHYLERPPIAEGPVEEAGGKH